MKGPGVLEHPSFTLRLDSGRRLRFVIDLVEERVRLFTEAEPTEHVGEIVGVNVGNPRCRLYGRFVAELNRQKRDIREAGQRFYDQEDEKQAKAAT